MNNTKKNFTVVDPFSPETYIIKSLEDEIRADQNCKELLKDFLLNLLKDKSITPLEAGSIASGADYYLRDFMIDNRQTNIFEISPELVQSFAGNWYIINTLEPNMEELSSILTGISYFYSYCAKKKIILMTMAEKVIKGCNQHDYYRQRIENFHNLSGDDYFAWNNACPLD